MNRTGYHTLVCAGSLALTVFTQGCHSRQEPPAPVGASATVKGDIGCYGRILPANGSFFASHYVVNAGTPIVERLQVREGDTVSAGQVLATLSSRPYLQQTVASAQSQVALAQARLARARVAGSVAERGALSQEVVRLRSLHDEAERNFKRTKALFDQDYASRTRYENAEAQLNQASAALRRGEEEVRNAEAGRPEDVAIAEAQLRTASAELDRARQDERSSVVRSPVRAKVLRVMAHAGEPVGPQGVAELAELGTTQVIAEVYEADIAAVHIGQRADITADFLPGVLHGRVQSVGSSIEKAQPIAGDPGAPADARVFKVHIEVPDQSVLENRMNGKVKVVIHG